MWCEGVVGIVGMVVGWCIGKGCVEGVGDGGGGWMEVDGGVV